MPNVTLTFDDELLERGRCHARSQNLSFNAFIRELVDQRTRPKEDWLQEVFDLADKLEINSHGEKWTRDELYRY